jgi:hypothetical protein
MTCKRRNASVIGLSPSHQPQQPVIFAPFDIHDRRKEPLLFGRARTTDRGTFATGVAWGSTAGGARRRATGSTSVTTRDGSGTAGSTSVTTGGRGRTAGSTSAAAALVTMQRVTDRLCKDLRIERDSNVRRMSIMLGNRLRDKLIIARCGYRHQCRDQQCGDEFH